MPRLPWLCAAKAGAPGTAYSAGRCAPSSDDDWPAVLNSGTGEGVKPGTGEGLKPGTGEGLTPGTGAVAALAASAFTMAWYTNWWMARESRKRTSVLAG